PSTATSLNNLGVLCYDEGNLPDAAAYMRRALAIRERVLGPQHPDTRQSRANLDAIEAAMGED
uniref:tetratricopeptide repeat protein n=1 Tax=Promineifilum sp. TaxID=2664178 RepID=UPI0035B075F2